MGWRAILGSFPQRAGAIPIAQHDGVDARGTGLRDSEGQVRGGGGGKARRSLLTVFLGGRPLALIPGERHDRPNAFPRRGAQPISQRQDMSAHRRARIVRTLAQLHCRARTSFPARPQTPYVGYRLLGQCAGTYSDIRAGLHRQWREVVGCPSVAPHLNFTNVP